MLIIYIILAIIALVLIAALFISKDMNYEKSIVIKAPVERTWDNVSSLAAMDKWSPWKERDPNMKQTITGTDGEVGATQAWESNVKNVGTGRQTIIKVEKPTLLETKLIFLKPFKSTASAYVKLDDHEGNTKATWGFRSKMPYPMNLMKLFMNFEKEMDKEFGIGLNKLKDLSENSVN